eukprot:GHVQ01006293.1.p1 GENE.GHVQ01006293.1~~GHVQ01006293.1.p1  ORF type:complete len:827 (-),score=128.07 GHVQ01006293.1:606-3086(-)
MIPIMLGVLLMVVVLPLVGFTGCSQTCRSKCLPCSCCVIFCCGGRRISPRGFPACSKLTGALAAILVALSLTAVALLGIFWTDKLNIGLSKSKCMVSSVLQDVVNGIPSSSSSSSTTHHNTTTHGFVGIAPALDIMEDVSAKLSTDRADRSVIHQVEILVDKTLNITQHKEALLNSLDNMLSVINNPNNNPDRSPVEDTHHMFVFNTIISKLLMLPKFAETFRETIDQSITELHTQADDYLGQAKVKLEDIGGQLDIIDYGAAKSSVEEYLGTYIEVDQMMEGTKDARYWVMISLYGCVIAVGLFSLFYAIYLFSCSSIPSALSSQHGAIAGGDRFAAGSAFDGYVHRSNGMAELNRISISPRWPSSKPSCCVCVSHLICSILALIAGGMMLTMAIFQADMCIYSKHDLLTDKGMAEFMHNLGVYDERTVGTATACLVEGSNTNLAEALDIADKFDEVPKVRSYLEDIQNKLPMPFNVSFIDELVFAADDYGWIFLINQTDVRQHGEVERLETYEEVLHSGIQDKGRYLQGPFAPVLKGFIMSSDEDDNDQHKTPVYGLLDIEDRIQPFYFEALHAGGRPGDIDQMHMITPDFDPTNVLVLEEADRRERSFGKTDRAQFLNAVWWAVLKQKLRASSPHYTEQFRCPPIAVSTPSLSFSPGEGGGGMGVDEGVVAERRGEEERPCSYTEFVEYLTNAVAGNVQRSTSSFAYVVEEGKYNLVTYINKTADAMLSKVEHIRDNLNCAPMSSGTKKVVKLWCDQVSQHTILVAIVWIVIGILCLFGFCFYYLIWRALLHNRYYEKLHYGSVSVYANAGDNFREHIYASHA